MKNSQKIKMAIYCSILFILLIAAILKNVLGWVENPTFNFIYNICLIIVVVSIYIWQLIETEKRVKDLKWENCKLKLEIEELKKKNKKQR